MEKIKNKEISNINIFDELKTEVGKNLDKKELNKKKLSILKDAIINKSDNFILKNIDFFEKNKLFQEKQLKKGEILFDEGRVDTNLYIIKSGRLSVQKYTDTKKTNSKELAILQTGDFFGEGNFKNDLAKKTKIVALENSNVLSIEGQKDLKNFIRENPEIGTELLFHIIDKTNNRLNETNAQIAINYEIDTTIRELKEINQNSLINLIDKIKSLINADYVVFIEKHNIVKNYFTIKYDSRIIGKFLNIGIESENGIFNLANLYKTANIDEKDEITINKINIGGDDLGFLIIGREFRTFSNNEKIISKSIANSLSGIIKQINLNKEEKEIENLKKAKMEY
ncbi:MAG: cyclic nucleotide-binding domain-containing protein [Candidatus Gracilibacteria bacterium]|nr:cyclic nucleotide-binding domain-containing protein [Candidatus Gracilibacteria bacterium]